MFQDFSVSGLAIDRCITWTCSHLRQDLLEAILVIFGHSSLTRSLPRDVYIRRKNDHPGGQGRIYISNLNFVSPHLSKPRHRSGCCCMSPGVFFVSSLIAACSFGPCSLRKQFFYASRVLSKWQETALWMFPDSIEAGTSCSFDGFRYDGDRSGLRLVES